MSRPAEGDLRRMHLGSSPNTSTEPPGIEELSERLAALATRIDTLNGGRRPEDARRSRVVVVHSFGRHLEAHALGLLTQGYPHLVTLNRNAVRAASLRGSDRDDLVLSRVRIASQDAVIPDLETIESDLLRQEVASGMV